MPNLRDRLPTKSAASGTSTQSSSEQMLLSRTQELQSVIANLTEELSKVQVLNQKIAAEKQQLAQENVALRQEHTTQVQRLMEAEQIIRDLEKEVADLRDVEDIACIEAVRRARMEMLIIRNAAEKNVSRQKHEYEAKIQQMSVDCRSQINAAREEAEVAIARENILRRLLFLLIMIIGIAFCAC